MDNPYFQILPIKILENLPEINELINGEAPSFNEDYLKEIISLISIHIQNKETSAPLKMAFIKKIVPGANHYIKALIELGIIVRSKYYVPGEVSYKYDIAPAYKSRYKAIPLTNTKLIRRIKAAYSHVRQKNAKSIRGHSEQTKYLRQININPDYHKYIETIQDTEKYNYHLAAAILIENGVIFYKKDQTSGRFHSNVTNLPEELRRFIKVKDESLVNVDVKNCQPYLSTIVLTNPSKISWLAKDAALSETLEKLRVSVEPDVKKYISLVVSGEIYEFLTKKFAEIGITLIRTETKRQVLRILFARNRMPQNEKNKACRQVFTKEFPTVHKIFSIVRGQKKGSKFQSYKRFAILLQSVEAYLMLDIILKRIYRELPGTIAITIHDSVLTGVMTNKANEVADIIRDEFRSFIGFEPKIKIEKPFHSENKEQRGIERERNREYYDAKVSVSN